MTDSNADKVLAHYGVKGMKWGVRKDRELVGRKTSGKKEESTQRKRLAQYEQDTKRIRAEMKKRGHVELDTALLKSKYGTPPEENPTKGLSRNQKIAIGVGIGVGVIGAVAAGYAIYKSGVFDRVSPIGSGKLDVDKLLENAKAIDADYASLRTARNRAYLEFVDGLRLNWDNEVNLSSESVLKRVSSVAEKTVREGGFFAAYRDKDVESYSAILPSFWKQWGVGDVAKGGFINHYQAAGNVKAPSGKKTLELFRRFVSENQDYWGHFDFGNSDDDAYGSVLKSFALAWAGDTSQAHPLVGKFFGMVKSEGYNALIDFNDAGILGKTPLRVIDSSIFSIVKNEALSFDTIVKAAQAWAPSLLHYFTERGVMAEDAGVSRAETVLAHYGLPNPEEKEFKHYGIKGMKWGVRRPVGKNGRVKKSGGSADYRKTVKSRKKRIQDMSNKELKALNERLNLEKNNRELQSRGGLNKVKRGTAIAGTILAVPTTMVTAYNLYNSPAGQKLMSAILKTKQSS